MGLPHALAFISGAIRGCRRREPQQATKSCCGGCSRGTRRSIIVSRVHGFFRVYRAKVNVGRARPSLLIYLAPLLRARHQALRHLRGCARHNVRVGLFAEGATFVPDRRI
jgi:hypothetical protein